MIPLKNIIEKIRSYITDLLVLPSKRSTSRITPKITKETVLALLLAEATKNYLLQLKAKLEKDFAKKQVASAVIKHHTEEHISLVSDMHQIQNNISKLNGEITQVNIQIQELTHRMEKELSFYT